MMQGLRILFGQTGHRAEWSRLVDEIVPDFVDLATDGPLPRREEQWDLVTAYRVQLAREAEQLVEAEAAGNALCAELEQTTDQSARAAWEHFTDLLKQSPDDD